MRDKKAKTESSRMKRVVTCFMSRGLKLKAHIRLFSVHRQELIRQMCRYSGMGLCDLQDRLCAIDMVSVRVTFTTIAIALITARK